MTVVKNTAAAEAIAKALAEGLAHPGDPERNIRPTNMTLPQFRVPAGAPPPYKKGVEEGNRMIAESIVYLLETQLDYSIVPNRHEAQLKEPT